MRRLLLISACLAVGFASATGPRSPARSRAAAARSVHRRPRCAAWWISRTRSTRTRSTGRPRPSSRSPRSPRARPRAATTTQPTTSRPPSTAERTSTRPCILPQRVEDRRDSAAAAGRRRRGGERLPAGPEGPRLPDLALGLPRLGARPRAHPTPRDRAAAHRLRALLAERRAVPRHGRARRGSGAEAPLPRPLPGGCPLADPRARHQGGRNRHGEHRLRAVDRLPRRTAPWAARTSRCSRTWTTCAACRAAASAWWHCR